MKSVSNFFLYHLTRILDTFYSIFVEISQCRTPHDDSAVKVLSLKYIGT